MAGLSVAVFTCGQMDTKKKEKEKKKKQSVSFHTEQREVVTEYHHAYQRQSSKLGYFLENSHTIGKKQTVFTFIHQSKQQTEAPQAL